MLKTEKFLYLDCQTTGMRPPAGRLLEIAWAFGASHDRVEIESHLILLPDGEEIPRKIQEITGIEDLTGAVELEVAFKKLRDLLQREGNPAALIHYAQFEKPYLLDMFERFGEKLEFEILCTHQMTKRIFPNLPSQNIRGAAGFFGLSPNGLKRAASHVEATHKIWRGLVDEVAKENIFELEALRKHLEAKPKSKVTRYEYRLDKLKRLELPDRPGIYRMISKSGEVLYVGKATSLKSRVNSYFRGKKGRDRRKLEMLAQVWDLRVTDCASPLEAALMETDEIKRYNPPYNVVLKRGGRHLVFYNRDFSEAATRPGAGFPNGPFRNSNWIEHLRPLFQSLHQEEFLQIFFNPIPPEDLRAGFELFCALHGLETGDFKSVRSLLAVGMRLHRDYVEPEEEEPDDGEDAALTIEEIAAKFERLLRRSAAELRRTRALTRLLNARVTYLSKLGPRVLDFKNGSLSPEQASAKPAVPWQDLSIDDFDRMSILLSELSKYEHRIEWDAFPRAVQSGT